VPVGVNASRNKSKHQPEQQPHSRSQNKWSRYQQQLPALFISGRSPMQTPFKIQQLCQRSAMAANVPQLHSAEARTNGKMLPMQLNLAETSARTDADAIQKHSYWC
jgi:hypothetical protein